MLILLRHGRTLANATGLLQGRLDNELDEVGLEQAARAAAAIGPVDRVISSPLARARSTAAAFGQPVEVDGRWIEYDYGSLEGVKVADVPADTWRRWATDADFAPPGGESYATLAARVVEACDELVLAMRTERIVVVSHVSPIKSAVAWVLGLPATAGNRYRLDVAAICRISPGKLSPVLNTFNETWHLA